MKVLVSSTGRSLDSRVDPRFGRAQIFAVVDTLAGTLEILDNADGASALQGAGIHAAEIASRAGIAAVITGHCGPKAFSALQQAGIAVYAGADGTVAQAVEDLKAGRLTEVTAPDVQGHWR